MTDVQFGYLTFRFGWPDARLCMVSELTGRLSQTPVRRRGTNEILTILFVAFYFLSQNLENHFRKWMNLTRRKRTDRNTIKGKYSIFH